MASIFRRSARASRAARPVLPLLLRSAGLRRRLLVRGDHLTPAPALQGVDDLLACPAFPGLIDRCVRTGTTIERMEDPGVPVLVAQSAEDRFFPPGRYAAPVEERLPHAERRVLPGVGHVPMADDPALVARTVLEWADGAEVAGQRAD